MQMDTLVLESASLFLLLSKKVVMDTGGMQGEIFGGTSNDNVNDSTKSSPVPVLKGGCRDARNHSDGDVV